MKTDILAIRIEPKMKKEFIEAAKADSRTMAGAVIVAIKDYIEKMKGTKP
jgi:predicted DNA-binding protein